jgi:hypothetical protein
VAAGWAHCASLWNLCVQEPAPRIFMTPGTAERLDLNVHGAGHRGVPVLLDFTRRCTMGNPNGDTLREAELSKHRKYASAIVVPADFLVVAMDHRGRMSGEALDAVARVAAAGARRSGSHPDDCRATLLRRTAAITYYVRAFALARAAAIAGVSGPGIPTLEELGQARSDLVYSLPRMLRDHMVARYAPGNPRSFAELAGGR